ncbi:hypothetical protein [Agromyces sp. Leaf222]|uniref:hypothetical protein n=1 Tax=Agromyces sp. Leaf222 TaxID=1735688 RepID=UPI0006F8163B|nr:hypothetical protein [Agromyces sp. Leaf222]KQM83421.1 hypothetical protein ASE68_09485 [Agromyces sp. Leaf222]
MFYGPNHAHVQAFIDSVPTLIQADWEAAVRFMTFNIVNLENALDEATMVVVLALRAPAFDQALTSAKASAIPAIDGLSWYSPDESSTKFLKQNVLEALGALVVLQPDNFEKLLPRFMPFRHTTAVLPVNWGG